MPSKQPLQTLDPSGEIGADGKRGRGKLGRPASILKIAERAIAETIRIKLDASCLVPCAMPKTKVKKVCGDIAKEIVQQMDTHELVMLVPRRIVNELTLLLGNGAVKTNPK